MKRLSKLLLTSILLLFSCSVVAQTKMKVAYVNMNQAINESNEGRRSKKFLEAQFAQSKKQLAEKKKEIEKKEAELVESLMLSEAAKAEKKKEIEMLKQSLMQEAQKEQNAFRKDENRHTAKIFEDLIAVIKKISEQDKYDLVLEFNIKQTILYSKYDMVNITKKVIEEYNKIQSLNK